MGEQRVPLGTTYIGQGGYPVIAFPVTLRIIRPDVLATLADFYVNNVVLGKKTPPPSAFGVKKVRALLEREWTGRGGSMAGDEVDTADGEDQEKAYDWADKVLARVWPVT